MLIDTHIHFDLKQFNKDLDEVIKNAQDKGVNKFIIPAVQSNKMEKILHICEKYENIYFASGNHPNYPDSFDLNNIEKLISHPKCVAVGECGLDWYRIPKGASIEEVKTRQKDLFKQQIELSIKYKKPLILHSRETDDDMLEILLSYGDKLVGGVIHCYVGSEKLLQLEKYNFYFGIGGIITYKNAIDLRNNLKKIPFHKFIIETDGPYLTPQQAKGKRNEPQYTTYIIKEIAKILNKPYNLIENRAYKNTLKLFNFNS
ncbi:TatD family hydrolase [bacterium]|jgi:TatD DNase family protein|nr:TatD family hydrolase [bacterium]